MPRRVRKRAEMLRPELPFRAGGGRCRGCRRLCSRGYAGGRIKRVRRGGRKDKRAGFWKTVRADDFRRAVGALFGTAGRINAPAVGPVRASG